MLAPLIRLLLISTALLHLSSCANVPIADAEFCGSLGSQGAYCAHLLTNDTRTMTLQEFAAYWNDTKNPKVATSISTITAWKADIEKLCTETGSCSVQLQAKVNALYSKLSKTPAVPVKYAAPNGGGGGG